MKKETKAEARARRDAWRKAVEDGRVKFDALLKAIKAKRLSDGRKVVA